MHRIHRTNASSVPPSHLRVRYAPMERAPSAAGWRINGHPARLVIWSQEEWEKLEVRPLDAQFHPYGVWCALRLD